jgi:hypothetical protein
MSEQKSRAGGSANIVLGAALVGLGILFLTGRLFNIDLWSFFWPFFIIVPGLLFFVGMVAGGKPAGPLAIPGSIVTTVGLILLYQSLFDHWESWAYAWSLIFPTSVGIGLIINGKWSDEPRLVESGNKFASVGLIIFLISGVFFELIINISHNFIGNVLWPLALIGVGVYLVARRNKSQPAASAPEGAAEEPFRPLDRKPAPPQPPAVRPIEPPAETPKPEFEPIDMTRGRKTRSRQPGGDNTPPQV